MLVRKTVYEYQKKGEFKLIGTESIGYKGLGGIYNRYRSLTKAVFVGEAKEIKNSNFLIVLMAGCLGRK